MGWIGRIAVNHSLPQTQAEILIQRTEGNYITGWKLNCTSEDNTYSTLSAKAGQPFQPLKNK